MLLVVIVVLVLSVCVLYVLSRNRKLEAQQIEVSLEELASIWLKKEEVVQESVKEVEKQVEEIKQDNKTVSVSQSVSMLQKYYDELIRPYEHLFVQQKVDDVLRKIIDMLDKHGNVPSVVIDVKDNESVDIITVRENLAQVSLMEHTFNVVRNMISIVKQNYSDPDNFIPQSVIVALAHDIGKIPELRLSGVYNSYDHQVVSANWLAEQFIGKDVWWAQQAVVAVRDHHYKSKDTLTQLLKQADMQARQTELVSYTKQYEIKSFEQWFNLNVFLNDYLEKEINVSERGKVEAFTFKGIVYVKPDLIYKLAKKYMFDLRLIDAIFLYESEKEEVIKRIVQLIRQNGLLFNAIGEGYFSRKFLIKYKHQQAKQNWILVAMYIEPFKDRLEEIERRKSGTFLELIDSITPV